MPAEFEKLRKAIKSQLKKDNPKMSDDELEKKSYAIATAQWKKNHGGKVPESADWHIMEFCTPIEESFNSESDFIIRGTAITETTTHNNHKYIAEELEKAAPSLINKPLLVDHENKIESIKGKVTLSKFDQNSKRVMFEAKVMDKNIQEMIKDGRINNVSIGAFAEDLIHEESTDSYIAKGLRMVELSLVAVPADSNATFAMAMASNYAIKESFNSESGDDAFMEDGYECKDCKMKFKNQAIYYQHMSQVHHPSKDHNGDKIPEKGAKMEKANIDTIERGCGEMTEESVKESEEVTKLKEELNVLKEASRNRTIAEYKAVCSEKKVKEKDVSKLSEDTIKLLTEQLKEIVISEKKEMKSVITENVPSVSDNFIVEKSEFVRGAAFWAMPDRQSRHIKLN
jgi:hypothetical protein